MSRLRLHGLVVAFATALATTAPGPGSARELESLLMIVQARGVHHWVCSDGPVASGTPAWRLDRVEVELLEPDGRPVARRGGLRAWQMADGTRLQGEARESSEVPARDDLPWLELRSDGQRGAASRVAQVMRFETAAARPAREACTGPQVGVRTRQRWTGEYYFFKPA